MSNNSFVDDKDEMSLAERQIKFIFLMLFHVPSVIFTIFILFNFKWDRIQIQSYGYVLIVNALILVIELPITYFFLTHGTVYFESICQLWTIIDYILFQTTLSLMAFISVQRYLFIYHNQLIIKHKILFHYGPIVLICLYNILFYICLVLFYSCESTFDVRSYLCDGPCYTSDPFLGLFDWIGNILFMEFIIITVTITVIIRHLIQRNRMKTSIISTNGRQQWRRSIKLVIQLISISMIYIIGLIPYSILGVMQTLNHRENISILLSKYLAYVPYIEPFLFPYLSLLFLTEIKQKLGNIFKKFIFDKIKRKPSRVEIKPPQTGQNQMTIVS